MYTTDKKSTGLETLTQATLTQSDLHIVGDVSDSGRAKAITENELEDYIANSTNFIDELTNNANFQTNVNNFVTPGTLTVKENGVSVQVNVSDLDFLTPGGIVSAPFAGTATVDLNTLISGIGGGGGILIDSDTTQKIVIGNTPTISQSYTFNIPGGTLGTENALRWKMMFSNAAFGGTSAVITVSATYGGVSIGSASFSGSFALSPVPLGAEGLIIESGTTNSQKSMTEILCSASQDLVKTNITNAYNTGYASSSVDSTLNQQLVITFSVSNFIGSSVTCEGVIVEKLIKSSGTGSAFVKNIVGNFTVPAGIPAPINIAHGLSYAPSKITLTWFETVSNTSSVGLRSNGFADFSTGDNNCFYARFNNVWLGNYENMSSNTYCLYWESLGSGQTPFGLTATADNTNIIFTPNTNIGPSPVTIYYSISIFG